MNKEYLELYLESELDISLFEFTLLVLIREEQFAVLSKCHNHNFLVFEQMVKHLEELGYLKWTGHEMEQLSFRKRAEDLFVKLRRKSKSMPNVESWIDDWRNLFPEGINPAGYRYRGNKLEVTKKMLKFVANHPYSKEEIFEATKRYIERFSVRGYNYMQQAHYFIEKKDTGSNLEAECENLREVKPQKEERYGGKVI